MHTSWEIFEKKKTYKEENTSSPSTQRRPRLVFVSVAFLNFPKCVCVCAPTDMYNQASLFTDSIFANLQLKCVYNPKINICNDFVIIYGHVQSREKFGLPDLPVPSLGVTRLLSALILQMCPF